MEKYESVPIEEFDPSFKKRPLGRFRSLWERQSIVVTASFFLNAILVVALTWNIVGSANQLPRYLNTDVLLGREIPWTHKYLERDEAFVQSDPFDGRWNEDSDYKPVRYPGEKIWSPWDDIYAGSFVWIHDPESVGLTGGVPMTEEGSKNDPLGWGEKDYVFGVAVMHQVHCVGAIKHVINEYRRNGNSSEVWSHTDHCLELVRQALMCHGDMTLTVGNQPKVGDNQFTGTNGFENTYLCRDWDAVKSAVRDHSVYFSAKDKGWRHAHPEEQRHLIQ